MQVVEAAVDPRAYDHLTFLPAHSEVPSVPVDSEETLRGPITDESAMTTLTSCWGNCPIMIGEQPQAFLILS